MIQVPQSQLLSLADTASLWAIELRHTSRAEHPDMLLNCMRSAFIEGRLNAADPTDASKKSSL